MCCYLPGYVVAQSRIIHIIQYIIGENHTLDRNLETNKFECPLCSYTVVTIRSIQKHCKDHVPDSKGKRVVTRYHPYADNPHNIGQHGNISKDTAMVNVTTNGQDLDSMDTEG
jgi:hypothetical protein